MNFFPEAKSTLGAYLVGAYLFSVPVFGYSESLGLLIVPQLMGAIILAYAMIDILKGLRIDIPKEIGLYGLLGLWALVTYLIGSKAGDWGSLSLMTLVKVVLATLACAQLIKNENDLYTALNIFVFSIVFVFVQNRGDLQLLRIAGRITEEDRFSGTLSNANTAAIFSLTVIWASLLLLMHFQKGPVRRATLAVPIGLSLLIIYYSGSKKGLIGLGLFVIFLGRLLYLRQGSSLVKKGSIFLIAAALLFTSAYFIYTSPFFFRMEQMLAGVSSSDINRFNLAQEAISVWLTNWKTFFVGVGFDQFRIYTPLQSYAHSTPLELLASNGIVGFLLFMAFLFLLVRKFAGLYRLTMDSGLKRTFFMTLIFLTIYTFFMAASVLHDSRELMPILGCLASFGQYHLYRAAQVPAGIAER